MSSSLNFVIFVQSLILIVLTIVTSHPISQIIKSRHIRIHLAESYLSKPLYFWKKLLHLVESNMLKSHFMQNIFLIEISKAVESLSWQ
jgi:hypothetical protein